MTAVETLKRNAGSQGWFFSIKTRGASKDGLWRDYNECYDNLREHKGVIMGQVWRGQHIGRPGRPPEPGEGFAIYYNSQNPKSFKNRVVVVGQIKNVEWGYLSLSTGMRLHEFDLEYDPAVAVALRRKPLQKKAANEHLFVNSGIKPCVVGTFFHVDPPEWTELLAEVGKLL